LQPQGNKFEVGELVGILEGLLVGLCPRSVDGDIVGCELFEIQIPLSQIPHGTELHGVPSSICSGLGQEPSELQGPIISQSFKLSHLHKDFTSLLYVQNWSFGYCSPEPK